MDRQDASREDAETARRDPAALPPRMSAYRISVVSGVDAGRSFEIDSTQPSRVFVGLSPSCVVRLSDAQVSRRHAAFAWLEDLLHLVDLQSTNGTYVNGVRVVEAILRGGETIQLGATTLRVDIREDPPPPEPPAIEGFGRVVGSSVEMTRLYPLFARIAASDVNLVIEGETGTGKEVLGAALHGASKRAEGPLIIFDCTTVPANLVESELFGHERGAFTGAVASRKGVFEQASGGTLFIDEIGELDPSLQPKLLRALEQSAVRRVGGDEWIRVDVRVIAATRRDLDREVQDGRFRDDLFFRLNVARVELPPLRHRQGDVSILAQHFWGELTGHDGTSIPYEALRSLERQPWPGNVRELRNAVVRLFALGDLAQEGQTAAWGSREPFEQVLSQKLAFPDARDRVLAAFEREYVERALEAHGGSVAKAAEASGIARRYFNTILARYVKR